MVVLSLLHMPAEVSVCKVVVVKGISGVHMPVSTCHLSVSQQLMPLLMGRELQWQLHQRHQCKGHVDSVCKQAVRR